ncbi:MAG: hypothetical protein ACJ740_13765 [Gaiellales bacterium]
MGIDLSARPADPKHMSYRIVIPVALAGAVVAAAAALLALH